MNQGARYTPFRWVILTIGCLAVVATFINMTALSPMIEHVAADLGVTIDAATNLMSIFLFAQAIFMFSGGIVADKLGIRSALLLGMLLAGLSCVALVFVGSNYWTVFFLRLVQGAALGFAFGAIGPIVSIWFPVKEQGTASALLIGSLNIGTALGVFIAPVLLESTGSWQKAFALLSILAWINLILVIFFAGKQAPGNSDNLDAQAVNEASNAYQNKNHFRDAMCMPITWVAMFIGFCNCWAILGLYNLAPAYLASSQPMGLGLGAVLAGKLSIALTLFGIAGTLCGGFLLDHVTHGNYRMSIILGFIITGIGGSAILFSGINQSMVLLVVFLLLAGFGIPLMDPAITSFVANRYDTSISGSMLGLVFGFGSLGGPAILALSSIAIGKTGSIGLSIALCCVATLAGAVLGIFLKFKKSQETAQTAQELVQLAVEQ